MNSLTAVFLVATIGGLAFLFWTYTKRGKKWLKDL